MGGVGVSEGKGEMMQLCCNLKNKKEKKTRENSILSSQTFGKDQLYKGILIVYLIYTQNLNVKGNRTS